VKFTKKNTDIKKNLYKTTVVKALFRRISNIYAEQTTHKNCSFTKTLIKSITKATLKLI